MSNSDNIVDWLSFSIPVYAPETGHVTETTFDAIKSRLPALALEMANWEFRETSGRAPYDRSYSTVGWRIFAGVGIEHVAIEISGVGCKMLRKMGLTNYVLAAINDRVSRIDIATDIKTDITPSDFISAGYSGRIRTSGLVQSDTGETAYIGSQKSDRYCRVYRYAPPHPRSDLLRIEYVFRRKEAKKVATELIQSTIENYAQRCAKTYDWKNEIMKNLTAVDGLTANIAHRTKAKTINWLIKQVAPAFKQLVDEGVIEEPAEWLRHHFLADENGMVDDE